MNSLEPAPLAIRRPATWLGVCGLKQLLLSRKGRSGECRLLESGLQCPCGDPSLFSTPHLPSPWFCCPYRNGVFPEKKQAMGKGGGCLWLFLFCHPPPPPRCLVPAESSRLPGSASVGNFPGLLYSRLCVNCFISSFPIHLRTGDRVTLPHNFTSVPIGGGRGSQGPGEQVEPLRPGLWLLQGGC